MTNPYAPPKDLSDDLLNNKLLTGVDENGDADLTVEGDAIVCADNATWPDRCVVCNQPTQSKKLTRKMYWHPSWIYLLVLFNWVIYLIVALIVRKTGVVHVSLCDAHRIRRRNGIIVMAAGFPLSFVLMFVSLAQIDGNEAVFGMLLIVSLLGMVATPIIGLLMSRTVVPKRIQKGVMWVKAGKEFTNSL